MTRGTRASDRIFNQSYSLPELIAERAAPVDVKPRHCGTRELTFVEVEVCRLVSEGLSNGQIAVHFGISENVIKNRMRRIFDKMGVWTRLELAIMILEQRREAV